MKPLALKIINIFVSFAFLFTTTVNESMAQENLADDSLILEVAENAFARLDTETFMLPAHLGEVRYTHKGSSDMVLVHLQDAHCNYYAQQKVSGIIEYINKEYGLRMVNLEGGTGDYDLGIFTSLASDTVRQEVATHFIKTGDINGAEFYAITNPDKILFFLLRL